MTLIHPIPSVTALSRGYSTDARAADEQSGLALVKNVTAVAKNRYGYQVPVWISSTAYERCVTQPALRMDNEAREGLWLFKVLALAKYAIQHADPGAIRTQFRVNVNGHKMNPSLEPLDAVVYPGEAHCPVLLIRHADEYTPTGVVDLLADLGKHQEAV